MNSVLNSDCHILSKLIRSHILQHAIDNDLFLFFFLFYCIFLPSISMIVCMSFINFILHAYKESVVFD